MRSNDKDNKLHAHFIDNRYRKGGEQRRKNARIPVDQECMYSIPQGDNIIHEKGRLTSISTGGLSMKTRTVLQKDDKIYVSFIVNGNKVNETAQITRITGMEVGMRFTEPDPLNQDRIQKFIYSRVFPNR